MPHTESGCHQLEITAGIFWHKHYTLPWEIYIQLIGVYSILSVNWCILYTVQAVCLDQMEMFPPLKNNSILVNDIIITGQQLMRFSENRVTFSKFCSPSPMSHDPRETRI